MTPSMCTFHAASGASTSGFASIAKSFDTTNNNVDNVPSMSSKCQFDMSSSRQQSVHVHSTIDTCVQPNVMRLKIDIGAVGRWTHSFVAGNAYERHVIGDEHSPIILRARLGEDYDDNTLSTHAMLHSTSSGDRVVFMNESSIERQPCAQMVFGLLPSTSIVGGLMALIPFILLITFLVTLITVCRRRRSANAFVKRHKSRHHSRSRRSHHHHRTDLGDLSAILPRDLGDSSRASSHRHSSQRQLTMSADESCAYLLPNNHSINNSNNHNSSNNKPHHQQLYVIDEQQPLIDPPIATATSPPATVLLLNRDTQTSMHSLDTGIASHSPNNSSQHSSEGSTHLHSHSSSNEADVQHLHPRISDGSIDVVNVTVEDITITKDKRGVTDLSESAV